MGGWVCVKGGGLVVLNSALKLDISCLQEVKKCLSKGTSLLVIESLVSY